MLDDIRLENVTQDQYDAAEAALINMVRSVYPSLDLRKGTVLRDILIGPASNIYALNVERLNYLQANLSLLQVEKNPEAADPAAVDNILSNFMVDRRTGTSATGLVKISVDTSKVYFINEGFTLTDLEGHAFNTTHSYTVSNEYTGAVAYELPLYASTDGTYFYFLLPVIATAVGSESTLKQGTALNLSTNLTGFITAESYSDFTDGVDAETLEQLIARLPAAVSHRGLESRKSIEAILREPTLGNFTELQALSVQGYGDAAQLRDKHNAAGVAMGSRVDLYTRTFVEPNVVVLRKTGKMLSPTSYEITIDASDAPGYYAVKCISEAESVIAPTFSFNTLPALGSYPFTEVRTPYNIQNTFHDISADNGMIETADTVYQQSKIIITDVYTTPSDTHEFKVELYTAPRLADIQAYVDNKDLRNVEADYIVRCPFIVLVGMRATVYVMPDTDVTVDMLKARVMNYINSRNFVTKLAVSEVVAALYQENIVRVDLSDDPTTGVQIQGQIRDASGVIHTLDGHELNIATIEDHTKLLTPETCVFAVEAYNIFIDIRTI